MPFISIEKLTFAYPGSSENVFEKLSLRLDARRKIGLVGRNGRGKTTLMRLLSGELDYSGVIRSDIRFGYFPPAVTDDGRNAADIVRELCPGAEAWEIERELGLLQLDEEALSRPFQLLSKGEQAKLLLAAMFLGDGEFMLIDEPTNHLDSHGRRVLGEYLARKSGYILASHDRRLLDSCTDCTLAINRSDIVLQNGGFSAFFADFEARQASEEAKNEQLRREIGRLKASAERTGQWSRKTEAAKKGAADKGFVGHKAAKMMKRSKAIEARRESAVEEKSALLKNAEYAEALKLSPLPFRAERLAVFSGVSPVYGGRSICPPVSFDLRRGERIALSGRNGCGKSSILRLLAGEAVAHSGKLEAACDLVISYVPQDTASLSGTPFDLARGDGLDESLFFAILRRMDFDRSLFGRDIRGFSEGQRKKILLAKSLSQKAHLYLWDEPLNFIDVYTRVQLERLICEFDPTMVFIEHDEAFRSAAATKIIEI